ncbi:MAG: hypothetical protein DMF68_13645 [Acidobacteria bacterium]|nr:MAG: hypothetical protein DMF68_13645 [Acidobacteriota bacterium]
MERDELIYIGEAVKALDDSGRVGSYLVRFDSKDLDGEHFTKNTYFGAHDGNGVDCLFHHMLPLPDVPQELTDHIFKSLKTTKDDIGIFAEVVLDLADKYEAKVHELVVAGKLGFSSGAPAHTVRKTKDGEIKRWIIAEGSLTPCPAEYQNRVVSLKAFSELTTQKAEGRKTIKALFEDIFEERTEGLYFLTDIFTSAVWRLQCMEEYWEESRLPDGYDLEKQFNLLFDEFKKRIWASVFADDDEGVEGDAAKSLRKFTSLPDGLKFADHSETVLAAVEGYALKVTALASLVSDWSERAQSIQEIRVKAGRAISTANQEKLRRAHDKIKTVESSLRDVRKGLLNLIPAGTDNKEVTVGTSDAHMKSVDDESLRADFQRLRTRTISSQVQ